MSETLARHINVLSGWAFPSDGFNELEGLPLIRIRDLGSGTTEVKFKGNFDPRYVIDDGDVLIGMDGDFSVEKWVGGAALLNQRVCKVESASDYLDQGFLYWYLMPHVAKIHRRTPQTTVRHLSASSLDDILAPPISVAEQRVVNQILDTLDTTIRQTEAIIEKLKQVRQGLLHDLLTRGMDANGELRPPRSQAPSLYKDSHLGWIPKEWSVRPLRNIGNFTNGLNKPKQAFGSGTKFVNISDVYADYMDTSALGRVQTTADDLNRYRLEPGDIALDRSSVKLAGVGYPSVFDGDAEPVAFCGFIIRLRLNDHTVTVPRYLCLQMRAARFRNEVFKVATGGANINVNQASLGELLVVIPSRSEQEVVVGRERAIDDRLVAEGALRDKLSNQKAGLMDDLLTGRVRVTPLLQDVVPA